MADDKYIGIRVSAENKKKIETLQNQISFNRNERITQDEVITVLFECFELGNFLKEEGLIK